MTRPLANACRLCAGSTETFIPVFDGTRPLNLAEKIKSYLHVEIRNVDDGDNSVKICSTCCRKITTWDEFAEHVRKVQKLFTSNDDNFNNEKDHINKSSNDQQKYVTREPDPSNCTSQVEDNDVGREKRKGKLRQKSGRKRKKKKVIVDEIESDFSDEDNIPLSNHIDNSAEATINRLNDRVNKGIRLTIKPLKEREVAEDKEEKLTNHCEEEKLPSQSNDEDDEDDGNDSKDCGELQQLFTWQCLECQSPVKNWNALVKHCRETHNSTASVQCVCGKFLQSRASIMKHRMKHTTGYEYKCQFENCNKTFHRQQLLDVHSLSHMPKELQPWMCCKCSRRFHTESLLKQHEKVHLPKEEKLIHPCDLCQKRFCSKSAVSAHVRAVHFGERPFVCDQCGHSFTSKGILHEHLTIHSNVYNFHCKDCNKSFKTKYRLKIHLDTHVETRYECPICGLTLNTRRTLRMHLLVHRDDKAFQCTTCGKAFKRSKDLKNHYNLHTGRRPYTCPFCLRTFANGSNCRSHKRRMHPEELKRYEAALAAGQQPVISTANEGTLPTTQEEINEDESNDSKSDVLNLKRQISRYSDDEGEDENLSDVMGKKTGQGNSDMATPLNLQCTQTKCAKSEVDVEAHGDGREDVESGATEDATPPVMSPTTGTEGVVTTLTQLALNNRSQNLQFSVHNFYALQSNGIPAFPGNSFLR